MDLAGETLPFPQPTAENKYVYLCSFQGVSAMPFSKQPKIKLPKDSTRGLGPKGTQFN